MDKTYFNTLMNSVFPDDWRPIKEDNETNNYIGALASTENFSFFRKQFNSMISDLKDFYKDNQSETNKHNSRPLS